MDLKALYQRFRAWQRDPFPPATPSGNTHHCLNCGNTYEGNHCPQCGQKYDVGPADWHALRDELVKIGGVKDSKSGLSFIVQLLFRPGYLISDYISGRRGVCDPPVGMLGVIAVAAMLVEKLTVNPGTDWVQPLSEAGGLLGTILGWLSSHLNWAILIQTVLLIVPTWLLFRFSPRHTRHTLPEGIYIQVFMGSLILICVMLRALLGDWILFLVPLYYFIAYYQLFGYGAWGTLWRTLLCLGIIFYFFGVLMAVRTRLSGDFWAGVSTGAFIAMLCLFIALGAGILYLGYRIGKKTAKTHN